MTIEPSMNLGELAEFIGSYATREDAEAVRDCLLASGYEHMDTSMISDSNWENIVIAAIGA